MKHTRLIINNRIYEVVKHAEDNGGIFNVRRKQSNGNFVYDNVPATETIERTYLKAK